MKRGRGEDTDDAEERLCPVTPVQVSTIWMILLVGVTLNRINECERSPAVLRMWCQYVCEFKDGNLTLM